VLLKVVVQTKQHSVFWLRVMVFCNMTHCTLPNCHQGENSKPYKFAKYTKILNIALTKKLISPTKFTVKN
jgi:hypothetical protein